MKHLNLVNEIPTPEVLKATEKPYVFATNDDKVQYHWKPGEYFECAGIKWMRTNLGATTETEIVFYYPWSGTIGYEDGSVCKFSPSDPLANMLYNKSIDELKAMGAIDDNGNLTPEYDAVTQAVGGDWRMPTNDELQSLLDNTNNTWEENFNGSGVNGCKFTLKDGSDYLFVPASGGVNTGSVSGVGSYGFVWNSSVDSSSTDFAHYLDFGNGSVGTYSDYRYCGFSVRGVKTT